MIAKFSTALLILLFSTLLSNADVILDDQQGTHKPNQTLSRGFVFYIYNGKNEVGVAGSQLEWPIPGESWSYYPLSLEGGSGNVARVKGTIGGEDAFPYIGMGNYLDASSSGSLGINPLNLKGQVTHFVFEARGEGRWRFKYSNGIVDTLAPKIGRDPEQVAWHMKLENLSATEFQWYALDIHQFQANIGEFDLQMQQAGLTAEDCMTSIYKMFWQTDGYTNAEAGTDVFIDVRNVILAGPITEIGFSDVIPTTAMQAEYAPALPIKQGLQPFTTQLQQQNGLHHPGVYLLNGRAVSNAPRHNVRTNVARQLIISNQSIFNSANR